MSLYVGKKKVGLTSLHLADKEKYNANIDNFLGNIDENGALLEPQNLNLVFNGVKSVGSEVLSREFYYNKNLISVNFPNLESVDNQGLYYCFQNCTNLTIVLGFDNLTTVDNQGLYYCFYNCSSLTTAPTFNSLTTVGDNGLNTCFSGCTSLTTASTFNNLTTVDNQGLYYCFARCSSLTTPPTFNNLTSIDDRGLGSCFSGCTSLTSLSFPGLNSNSFGTSTNQFSYMLSGVTGCTVHFPSNLQSVIGSWDDVTSGFGGTDTTVLFDLPATE